MNDKLLKIIQGGMIGDSLLLPYEFLKKKKAHKRFAKYQLKQSLIENYGITSDDSDHLIMTYQALNNTHNVKDFQKILAKKLKSWFFTFPIGIGFTTIKSIVKLLLGFSPEKSGINSLGNGSIMRVAVIAGYFANNEIKRNEYIKASSEIMHNHREAIKVTQLIGNVIAYIVRNNKKPNKEELIELLKCDNFPLISQYIHRGLNNLDSDLESFLATINSSNQVTGYILTSCAFMIYVLHNTNNYKQAFEMIVKASGDTDTIGAVIGSVYALLDRDMIENTEVNKLLLTNVCEFEHDINNYGYIAMLKKNLISIPIILYHAVLRFF